MADESNKTSSLDHFLEPGAQAPSGMNLNISSPSPSAGGTVELAGIGRRFVAVFLDGIIVSVATSPVKLGLMFVLPIIAGSKSGPIASFILNALISLVVCYFYYGYFYSRRGATPGKMVMGLRVLRDQDGTYLSYNESFLREFVGKGIIAVCTLGIDYLVAFFRDDRKTLHDIVFKTKVVHVKQI